MRIPKISLSLKDSSPSQTPSSSSNSSSSSSTSSHNILLLKEDLCVEEEFQVLKTLSEGTFSKITLASLKKDCSKVIIKSREGVTPEDFNREVEITYLLSPHPNSVTCYNITFIWQGAFCFLQEYAGYSSLSRFLRRRQRPLGEEKAKLVCAQVASALEFMHQLNIIHSNVRPSNILLFNGDLTRGVKVSDYSGAHKEGELIPVTKTKDFFTPPEISELVQQEKFYLGKALDSWQLGILAFYLVQGRGPWGAADYLGDQAYHQYCEWIRRKSFKVPEALRTFTNRFRRLFKRLCEPKEAQRASVRELRKYLKDEWLIKKSANNNTKRKISDVSTNSATMTQDNNEERRKGTIKSLIKESHKDKHLQDWIKKSSLIN